MMGLYAEWQPIYEAHGVATFPVNPDKRPAVKHYLRIGARGSRQLALKFTDSDAFGLACKPNKITVVDVDTNDEAVLVEALDRHGQTPFIVRSGSGNYQAWYRNNGERRKVRPDPGKPVDILGDGYVVCPPSKAAKGSYEIIQGSLEDLDRLPKMRAVSQPQPVTNDNTPDNRQIVEGQRDNGLFRGLLRAARTCNDFDDLLDLARTINMETCTPPLSDAQVIEKAKSAWRYQISGNNWVGRRARASTDRDEILAFSSDPYAALLLNLLRVSHVDPDAPFAIDQVKTAELLGWNRRTLVERIRHLMAKRCIARVHHGRGKGDPHIYVLCRQG